MLRHALRATAIALLLALTMGFLVACGDDEEDQQQQTAAQTEQQEQSASTTTTASGTTARDDAQQQTTQTRQQRETVSDEPLKLGFLADYSGAIAEFGPAIETGVRLAIKHLNDAGGVLGRPVELYIGDTGLDPTRAVEEARRLVEIEGVHAIVGPLASSITLAVAESVTAPAGIPTISPSATSPQLSIAEDNDYLFRSTVSDAAQGPVLAQLAADEGYRSVGVLYLNDPYGQGLAEAFAAAWGGEATLASIEDGQSSYLSELQQIAGAEVLIAIAFPTQAEVFIREALENGLFDQFLFVDGTKSQELVDAIGGDYFEGMKGTAPSAGPESAALRSFNESYESEYGELSPLPFIREAYDATIALALAAESAGSVDSGAIRNALRDVATPPGDDYGPGPNSVAAALDAIRSGDTINYTGAATTLDWDANGDVTTGYIGVWQYRDGGIVELSVTAFDLSGGVAVAMPSAAADTAPISDEPLKIAFLADFSGPLAEFGPVMQTAVDLAVGHVNAAGGVLGHEVVLVIGDTGLEAGIAVEEARRLVEIEGVHGIVGPLTSSNTLQVAESVTAAARVPTISPSATSPQLSLADDDGYLFRSTISDAAQGPVLADLASAEGYTNVGVLYINDPYGQGLADAFAAAFDGAANLVSIEDAQASYLSELQQAADNDAQALVAIAFPRQAEIFIREALEQGLFDQFIFVDGSKSEELIDAIGGEYLNGMRGTAPIGEPESATLEAWNNAYLLEYGELPTLPFVTESYDAAIALMLAAQAAGSLDGAAIRDALPRIAAPGGEVILPGAEGIARALEILAAGGEINYQGGATTLDWNAVGDVTSGYIGIWQYADGGIEEIEAVFFQLD